MATWLRSREGAKCPRTGKAIRSEGSKWDPRADPCEDCRGKCPHAGRIYVGAWQATVQCKWREGA